MIEKYFALSECPSFFPFQSIYSSYFASLSDAERDLGYDVVNENNTDTFKDNGTSIPMSETGEWPDDFLFAGWRKCFSCDTPEDLNLSEEDCLKCPNRVYKVYPNWHISQCERLCPPDKPLMDSEGICYACNTPVPIGLVYNIVILTRLSTIIPISCSEINPPIFPSCKNLMVI